MPLNTHKNKIKYSICVSGAASGVTVSQDSLKARQLGEAIAKKGHILTTGATVGLPYYAAVGARAAGGMSIGFSPAVSLREHLRKYRLPSSCFDFINFTGMHYVGRDLYLVQSSDAIITIGGRFGSLHEFTSALEAHKPCAVLSGSGGTADEVPKLLKELEPPNKSLIIFDDDPAKIVDRIIAVLDDKYQDIVKQIALTQEDWFLKTNNQHVG